nr:pentapeptide repeat-containing protein [uncultured Capnocytophaga sp.]
MDSEQKKKSDQNINKIEKYIKDKIFNNKKKAHKIRLHNLPNDETLFDVIDELREAYKEETLVFTEEIKIIEKTIDKEVNFSNCIFQEDVNFSGCIFKKKSLFSYIKNNEGEIIANASIFEKGADFSKAIFKEAVNFSGTKFSTKIEIDDNSKILVNFGGVKFEENTRFHYCEFCNSVSFENTTFNKLVDFYYAKFFKPQQFHLTDFFDRAIFSNAIFYQETQFIYCRTKSDSYIGFESAEFKRGLDISRSNFGNDINFWNITIEKEGEQYIFNNLENVKYANDFEAHDEVPSVYKQLRETYRIIKDSFYKQSNKIEVLNFYEKEMSIYLKELNNTSSKDKEGKIISDSEKKEYNLFNSFGVYVSGFFFFLYLFFYISNYNNKDYYISFLCFFILFIIFAFNNWNSRIPVNHLLKIKNFWYLFSLILYIGLFLLTLYYLPMYIPTIFAIEYSVLTVIVLLLYLFFDNNRILLYFNKYSNNFGTNWVYGIIFTILSSLLTFSILINKKTLILKVDVEGVGNFLKALVDILNLTDWNDMTILGEKLTNWQYIFLFIGRIFIAYGIYQTVQAFRKYGKT